MNCLATGRKLTGDGGQVADGIRKGDFDQAATYKTALENAEREKRKLEKEGKQAAWQPRLCRVVENDPEYARLAKQAHFKPDQETSYVFGSA